MVNPIGGTFLSRLNFFSRCVVILKYIILSLILAFLAAGVYAASGKLPPEKCASCHSESLAFRQWQKSGHARSLKILLEDSTASASCLRCHSADYKSSQTNPWMSRSDLPTLQTATNAVSCSACHKHDSGFQDNLIMPVEKLCTKCHVLFCGG